MNHFGARWRHLGPRVHEALERVGARGQYVLGQEVCAFEHALAGRWRRAHAVGCGSGLDALEIGLRALGVGAGDLVLTTPLSAFASTLAILRAGARPVYVDTDRAGLMDLDLAADALGARAGIRCVVPVHLYGLPLDLERLERLRDERPVAILEDCAQAIGASSRGRLVGTVGEAAAVSFYPTKNLGALGDGGALLTNSGSLDRTARAVRDYGQRGRYDHAVLGMNSRLDELQAAILLAFLPEVEEWTRRRRLIAARYLAGLAHPRIAPPAVAPGAEPVWHLFPVFVAGDRDDLMRHLAARGIASDVHYPRVIPDQGVFAQPGAPEVLVHGTLENARALARSELSLPIHPYLSDVDVEEVIHAVNTWA